MKSLTTKEYWQEQQGPVNITIDRSSCIYKWLQDNFSLMDKVRDCIEIGCFPGRYLSIFAEKGIEVNGLDYIGEVKEIPKEMKKLGYKVGDFYCSDIKKLRTTRQFDLVCSFGFIEHFDDWEAILLKHCALVTDKGYILIEVPNFRGWMQHMPRILFDRECLEMHNIASMNPKRWEDLLQRQGFTVLKSEYIGGYMLWFERKANKIERVIREATIRILRQARSVVYRSENDAAFSGAVILLAQKNQKKK